jgi:glutaryl-CoA dehydrogenase
MAQSERATQRPTAFRAPFHWDDPFLLEQQQITEDERIISDTARGYAQEKLQPRVTEAYLEEKNSAVEEALYLAQ